jgi:hypothetical protein
MGPQVTKKKIAAALFALFALSGSAQAGTYIFRVAVPGLQASSGSASTPPAAALSASPATVAFGLVPLGQSLSQTVTFSNTGAVAATGLVYNLPTGYTSTGNCGPTLTATGQCTETVTFTPTAAQSYPGNYTVTGLSVSAFAVLSGTGGLANLNANPTTLTFASTQISRTSAAQAVTLTNSGNAAAGSLSIRGGSVLSSQCSFRAQYGGNLFRNEPEYHKWPCDHVGRPQRHRHGGLHVRTVHVCLHRRRPDLHGTGRLYDAHFQGLREWWRGRLFGGNWRCGRIRERDPDDHPRYKLSNCCRHAGQRAARFLRWRRRWRLFWRVFRLDPVTDCRWRRWSELRL